MYCANATELCAESPIVKTAIKDAANSIFVFIPFTCRFPASDLFNFYSKAQQWK